MFMTLLGAFDGVYSVSPAVTIQSFSYPNKVNPNEKFSIQVVLMCHDVNGWAKVRLYLKEHELKVTRSEMQKGHRDGSSAQDPRFIILNGRGATEG
jgi:hypothetical protein